MWQGRVSLRQNVDPELTARLAAYARQQTYVHRRIAEQFEAGWRGSMATAVQQVVERDGLIYTELLAGIGVERAPELGLAEAERMSVQMSV
jgi:hypothetical protein